MSQARSKNLSNAATVRTSTFTTEAINMEGCSGYAAQSTWTAETPDAGDFTADDETDTLTQTGHGYATGLKGQASNAGGALPTGLADTMDYFVIAVDEDTYKLAETYADAVAGTAIDIEDAGTGTHTFTPATLSASVKLQRTVNGTWVDVTDSSTNITADGNKMWEAESQRMSALRQVVTIAAGQVTMATRVNCGD